MKKIIGSFVSFVLSLGLVFSHREPVVYAQGAEPLVTPYQAKQAAAWQVVASRKSGTGSKWTGKKQLSVGKPVSVYDPSGQHVAYWVNVKADGKPAGFVMVSAFANEDPIVAWAEEGEPDVFKKERTSSKLRKNKKKFKSHTLIWVGGVRFLDRFTLTDNSTVLIDEFGKEIPDYHGLTYTPALLAENVATKLWDSINDIELEQEPGDPGDPSDPGAPGQTNPADGVTNIDPATWETNYDSIRYKLIATTVNQKQWVYHTVNGVQQWVGCTPAAGSNLMKYWADKGYTMLNPTANQQDIVMELRATMQTYQGTDGGGYTNWVNIASGLQQYARDKGLSTAVATRKTNRYSTYATIVSEIDLDRPVLQSWNDQYYFTSHSATVIGYKEFVRSTSTNSSYTVVRSNWATDTVVDFYVKYGTWTYQELALFTP